MEGDKERKDARLMSSLIDLKLDTVKAEPVYEEGKRKTRKVVPLKGVIDSEIYENFTEVDVKKTFGDKEAILKSLKSHFTFSALIEDREIKETLLEKFRLCRVDKGDYLMKENDNASSFFILREGSLAVEIKNKIKRCIQPGQGFGELALLYSAPRSASIIAIKQSLLWFIDRETFRTAVSSMIIKNFKQNREFIENNAFFKYLTDVQKDKLASLAISQIFEKNSEICKQGDPAFSIYVLKSGKLAKLVREEIKGYIEPGQSFEEYASLTKGCLRRETIKVLEDCQVMALGVEEIENALGKSLPLIVLRNDAKVALKPCGVINKLSQEYMELFVDCLKLKSVKKGEHIVRRGDICRNMLFFVAEGKYIISNYSKMSDFYGACALTNEESLYDFSITMTTNGKIAWTTLNEVQKHFGCNFKEAVVNTTNMSNMRIKETKNHQLKKITAKKLDLKDFLVLKKLGEGQFGNVFLVTDASKQNYYALKCISKQQTIKSKLEMHLQNEKIALENITSPFVMEYIRSYRDNNFIYFLTEFINGVELFDAIRIIGLLNADQTIFYAAQLLHIIETLHAKSFIYRDLKPENVMVCENGYLKLIDMGTCKKIKGNLATERTFTMIGTPNYMAPETLSGKGYSSPIDLWSLGIVLYEFMAGFVPFGDDAQDPYEIYQQILKNPLQFPKNMKNEAINSFIAQLLNKKPQVRLGGSFTNLKKHPVFYKLDWLEIMSQNIKPLFLLPKEKIIDCEELKSKAKPLVSMLKAPNKIVINRKDLNPNWDQHFDQ